MKAKKILIKGVCVLLALIFTPYFSYMPRAAETPPDSETIPYQDYADEYKDSKKPQKEIVVNSPFENEQEPGGVMLEGSAELTFDVEAEEEGLYLLELTYSYYSYESLYVSTVDVFINGGLPYSEAAGIELPRLWKNDGKIKQDKNGNDVAAKLMGAEDVVSEYTLKDSQSLSQDMYFHLKQGKNTIRIAFEDALIQCCGIKLYNKSQTGYEAYHQELSGLPETDFFEVLQAEQSAYRNSSALIASSDRTGPQTMPSHPVDRKLNVISGTSWKLPGEAITWALDVPEDGLYEIGIRWRQNYSPGVSSSRRLLIDNQSPFSELEDIKFPYGDRWQYTYLGNKDDCYKIHLTAGQHTITMENVCGELLQTIFELQEAVYLLNSIYRKIIMLTGVTPDLYRDYNFKASIPELSGLLLEAGGELERIAGNIEAITGQKGGQASVIWQLSHQIKGFLDEDWTIPERLSTFKSNIGAVAAFMLSLQEQPLDIDYITVRGTTSSAVPEGEKIGFFGTLYYHLSAFIGSFFNDYSDTQEIGADKKAVVDVWANCGREQFEIIKQLADEQFGESGIAVRLKLVQIPLTQAVLANTAPDVLLGTSRGQPVNLGIRGVLADLSTLDGFEELSGQFAPEAILPYSHKKKVFGIPVTMGFHMMFLRTDILSELGLTAPDTWEEFHTLISKIQRSNMTVGLPYSAVSSQGSIETGMGTKDIFPALVFQNGGRFYDENGFAAFDDPKTTEAFQQWVKLYTETQLDLQFDFYNRFRTGEMPVGISDYSFYSMLEAATPEIKGLWEMRCIPGTRRENGSIDRSEAASGSAAVILEKTKHLDAAWDIVKWWTSADIQAAYGIQSELLMGKAARYNPANLEAIKMLPWKKSELALLQTQISHLREIPEVIGGYYTARGIDNAIRNTILNSENYCEALLEQMGIVNTEIVRKQKEFS